MKIVYLNGDDAGKSVDLTPSGLTIGRETDNHLQLPVGGVSRYHARIEFVEGAYMLRDLGSTNGTKLNGVLLQKIEPLKANDIITIGEQQLRVDEPRTEGGTDSKIGTSTVKIPAGIPVPEPAVPQFVFRPDSEPQPPPPPPVTDSSETATVNVAPEIAEAGNDFFVKVKHDNDGNFFKKDDAKKESGKSSLRSNLIFALVIMIMICGGLLLFNSMNKEPADKKEEKKSASAEVANDDFFFFYEMQEVDEKSKNLIRKKVYCRQINGVYTVTMAFDNHPFSFKDEKTVDAATIKRLKDENAIENFAKLNTIDSSDTGNELKWTRLAIGVGNNVHDSTVIGDSSPAAFRHAKDKVERLINQLDSRNRMRSEDDLRAEAERTFKLANMYYSNRDSKLDNNSKALDAYMDVLKYYNSIGQHTEADKQNLDIAHRRASELNAKLKEIFDSNVSKADIAFTQGNYSQARKLCIEAKKYFSEGSKEFIELGRMEGECTAKIREQQKGNK